MDVWNALEEVPDGATVFITVKEMTVPEFTEQVKEIAELNATIKKPQENGPVKT
jgi:hypothetical protein